jgi:hypothetical protein
MFIRETVLTYYYPIKKTIYPDNLSSGKLIVLICYLQGFGIHCTIK